MNRVRVEVPLLDEISDDDARSALFSKFTCEVSGTLPGHRVRGGRDPGCVEASLVRPVLDRDLVGFDEVQRRGDRERVMDHGGP